MEERRVTTLIKDPVCGMMVDPGSARTESYSGKVYAFCSESCRQKFHADPASYAAQGRTGSEGSAGRKPGS